MISYSIRDWTGLEPIKQKFPRMRQPIETLDNLRKDAEADRSWWETYFCPPEHKRASRLQERLDNPVDTFVREHPEFLLGPVSLGLQGLETAGAIAVQRVAPKLLAAGIVATSWENFLSYMKGGKEAVGKKTSSGGSPNPSKERVVNTDTDVKSFFKVKETAKKLQHYRSRGNCVAYKHTKTGDIYYKDGTHTDIEVFSAKGPHKGSIDPKTRRFYKPANQKYSLPQWLK